MPTDRRAHLGAVRAPLVERVDELAVLRHAASDAETGRPRVVWIEGPAGVGKSALVRTWLDELRPDAAVLRVTGDELGADASWLALADVVDVSDADAVGPVQVGRRVLERLSRATTAWVGVLIVEDVHWMGLGARRALASAVRQMDNEPFLVVVTARPDVVGLDGGWSRIRFDTQRCTIIDLPGLTTEGVSSLAAQRGLALPPVAASQLRAHTDGNPLYLTMLFSEVAPATLAASDQRIPAPRAFAATVTASLRQLPAPARDLIGAIAVVNRPMALPAIAEAADIDGASIALDQLVDAGLAQWERDDRSVVTVAVAHPLIRAAVYDDLAPGRRCELHLRASRVVDGEAGLAHRVAAADRSDEQLAAELEATAWRESTPASTAARMLRWSADLSPDRGAFERRTLGWARLMLRIHDLAPVVAQRELIEAFQPSSLRDLVLGRLAWFSGNVPRAQALLASAASGDDVEIAAAASIILANCYITLGQGDDARKAASNALGLMGHVAYFERLAFTALAIGSGQCGGAVTALELCAERLPNAPMAVPEADLGLLITRGVLHSLAGRFSNAIGDLNHAIAVPGPHHIAEGASRSRLHLAKALVATGRWDEALIHARVAVEFADDTHPWERAMALEPLVVVLAGRGEWDLGAVRLDELQRAVDNTPTGESRAALRSARIAWHQARNEHDAVVAAAAAINDPARAMCWFDHWAPVVRSTLQLDRLDEAARLIDELETAASIRRVDVALRVHELRARLAVRRGEPARAAAEFTAAFDADIDEQPVLDVALARIAYGQLLRAGNDRQGAIEQLRAARHSLAALSAKPYLDAVDQHLEDIGLPRPERRRDRSPLDLTTREHDVVTLATKGLMNKQIAAELFISTKAVEFHLRNIYGKLGITSRRELTQSLSLTE